MDVFELRERVVGDYAEYVRSFLAIRTPETRQFVDEYLDAGQLWPEPLVQLNPTFQPGPSIDTLVAGGQLHSECGRIFRRRKHEQPPGQSLQLHQHQADAIDIASSGASYAVVTGTGSGKSLTYLIPIVNALLHEGTGRGIRAIVVYPMNALANSQCLELKKFLCDGYPEGREPVRFAQYTGQEWGPEREGVLANPPDILLTNYVMLELILTRADEHRLIQAAQGLRFLVLDELHTYRGRQGADVALLMRRTREALAADRLQCVGTSATLAGPGNLAAQREEVAAVASRLFGLPVQPEHVIGETLQRATPEHDMIEPVYLQALKARVLDATRHPPADYAAFVADPLSVWIESTFGVRREPSTGRLLRAQPGSLTGADGAARRLSMLIGVPESQCEQALREGLLAGYQCQQPDTGFPAFAFRLHQFISRGDTVYASLEPEVTRVHSLSGQQFVPGHRDKVLLPLVFCRECGQEYYSIQLCTDAEAGGRVVQPRAISDRLATDDSTAGYLYLSSAAPWPDSPEALAERLPEDWIEEYQGQWRVRTARRRDLPQPLVLDTLGREVEEGTFCHFVRAPFRFCLRCGVEHGGRQTSDFGKLTTLSSEGRSTATTILSLAAIQGLRRDETLLPEARKLLSFTDNRQDASLQAGHFNDFVEIGMLRAALYQAVSTAGSDGLRHDELAQRVADALALPFASYAADPAVRYAARTDTERALRAVLGYRLYRDLKRGWRITSPNLEQSGLLEIRYPSLEELCADEPVWQECHDALHLALPETRSRVARVLLDYLRRELALKVDYLDQTWQERLQHQSSQHLRAPWALDEGEVLENARVLYPRAQQPGEQRDAVYLSERSGFGIFLRRRTTFPNYPHPLRMTDTSRIIDELLKALRLAALVQVVVEPRDRDDVPGYQLPAAALEWVAGDGKRPFHDPIRMPNLPTDGARTNQFFVDFYRTAAGRLQGLEAREHTAQVVNELRQKREEEFRAARLPILYCSPTMELGVDIAELNAVNMRNVPPTPANYAQRSGRAGRQGQPALVFTYCSSFWPHDQYFFRRPELMVAGAVSPPRIDLTNEDLLRAHVQAIWLAETRLKLGHSLADVLDVQGERPTLALTERVRAALEDPAPRHRARERAERVLSTLRDELAATDWWSAGWLDDVLARVEHEFDQVCERWRGLYRAARGQVETQNQVILDYSRSATDKEMARRLRNEAEAQLALLTQDDNLAQSDFYSYRYFASEGFLPGYSFPRLPLAAYIPGRRGNQGRNEFVSRPRFLAINEFAPRAVLYHEGARYVIHKVILPVREQETPGESTVLPTQRAKLCERCGYLHPVANGDGLDLCERCSAALPAPLTGLFRMQNVATRRRDRITSDEEERQRFGYEIHTGVRFAEHGNQPSRRLARVERDGEVLAQLTYGHTATLWRVNVGWLRRSNPQQYGFVLDVERGYWARSQQEQVSDPNDLGDALSAKQQRVIPFVEDRRNCLLIDPGAALVSASGGVARQRAMASLREALKAGIQAVYQLEDSELAAEPLPSRNDPRLLLFYEAAEGGAGVLRRLLDDPAALAHIARASLEICHFDADTGADRRRGPRAREDCEAACYDCLLSYYNQIDHQRLDRQLARDALLALATSKVVSSNGDLPPDQHLEYLLRQADSELEREWLRFLWARGHRLPNQAQTLIEECQTRPDFYYQPHQVAVYIDGPAHEYPDRQQRDRRQTELMEDYGYQVLRFSHSDDWLATLARYPSIFGPARVAPTPPRRTDDESELDLFEPQWQALVRTLRSRDGLIVEPGGDVIGQDGRVVGSYGAAVFLDDRECRLVDADEATADDTERACAADGQRAVQVPLNEPTRALAIILEALEQSA